MEHNIAKVILVPPRMVVNVRREGRLDAVAIPFSDINFNIPNATPIQYNLLWAHMKKIITEFSRANEIWIYGERSENATIENPMHNKSQFHQEVYHSLLDLKEIFIRYKCFDVGEITNEIVADSKARCTNCGYIRGKVTCNSCGEVYKDSHPRVCPKCKSKDWKAAHVTATDAAFTEEHINPTVFAYGKTKCPKCKSTKVDKPKPIHCYRLIVKKQKRFEPDEQ